MITEQRKNWIFGALKKGDARKAATHLCQIDANDIRDFITTDEEMRTWIIQMPRKVFFPFIGKVNTACHGMFQYGMNLRRKHGGKN